MIAVLNGITLLDTVKYSVMVCLHTKNKGSGIGFWLGVRALSLYKSVLSDIIVLIQSRICLFMQKMAQMFIWLAERKIAIHTHGNWRIPMG